MNEDKNFLKCIKRLFPDVPGSFFKMGDDGQYPEPIQDHWIVWQEATKNAVKKGFKLIDVDHIEDITDSFNLLLQDIGVHRDYGNEHTAKRDFNEIMTRVEALKEKMEKAVLNKAEGE